MKKILLILCLLVSVFIEAQTIFTNKIPEYRYENKFSVGIQNSTALPTDVYFAVGDSATTKAMFIPRVQTTSAIANPRQGMVVYSISDSSFYYRSLFGWRKGITTSSVINDLADVNITTPVSGHVLTYITNEWVNQAPTTYTASEGLHMNNLTNVRLGGTLTGDTTIATGVHTLTFLADSIAGDAALSIVSNSRAAASNLQKGLNVSLSGANSNSNQTTYGSYITNTHTGTSSTNVGGYFNVSGGTTNYGVRAIGTNYGVSAESSGASSIGAYTTTNGASGFGTYAENTSTTALASIALGALSQGGYAGWFRTDMPSSTNTVATVMAINTTTSGGVGADGIGAAVSYKVATSTSGSTVQISNELISKWTTANNATRTSQFIITGVNSGTTGNKFIIDGDGTITLPGTPYVGLGAGYIAVSNTGVLSWSAGTGGATPGIDDVLAVGQALTTGRSIDAQATTLSITGSGTPPFQVTSTGGMASLFSSNPSSTNTVVDVMSVQRTSSGTVGANIGAGIQMKVENNSSQNITSTVIQSILTTITSGAEVSKTVIQGINGGTLADKFVIEGDGRIYGTGLHDAAGAVTGTTNQYIASGTYTPTLTSVANVSASTNYLCQWIRVGNVVTVSGKMDIDATTTVTLTQLGISLPIASSFTNSRDCGGTGNAGAVAGSAGAISADATNDRAQIDFVPTSVTNDTFYFTFTYLIL